MRSPRASAIRPRKFASIVANRAITAVLASFARGFAGLGTPEEVAPLRTVPYVAALRAIADRIVYKRLRVAPNKAPGFVGDIRRMPIEGLR